MKHNYALRAEKILARIHQLAAITDDPGGITRTLGSPAFLEGRRLVLSWMEQAGLQTRTDNAGNARGRLPCGNADAKTFVIASHIDTVINAGRFDGPLGVIAGLDIIEQLIAAKVVLPFHIELIAFSDEEGVRFHTTYLGSKAVAGSFEREWLLKKDADGVSLGEVLSAMGGDPSRLHEDALPAGGWLGYFELHIEQGPVLYESGIPAAVVTAIAGQHRLEAVFTGEAGHAGTVPMDRRRDALCGAAEAILETERQAKEKGFVATVGKLSVAHAASNVIPGSVTCSLDIRSEGEAVLQQSEEALRHAFAEICRKRGLQLTWTPVQRSPPVACSPALQRLLAQAAGQAGLEPVYLVSGAGHDAVPISAVAPVAMLFVRCFRGISHHPMENVERKDIAAAIEIADNFIHLLIQQNS